MSQTSVIIFPLQPVTSPYELGAKYQNLKQNWSTCSISSAQLSEMLNQQNKNNDSIFEDLIATASSGIRYREVSSGTEQTISLPFTIETIRNFFRVQSSGFTDVSGFDQTAFSPASRGITAKLYGIVLLWRGEYWGHIYAWKNREILFAVGIRSRIDSSFQKLQYQDAPKVANVLQEGVRMLALLLGCSSIIIPQPLPVMEQILPSLGFQIRQQYIGEDIIGRGLLTGAGLFAQKTDLRNIVIDGVNLLYCQS